MLTQNLKRKFKFSFKIYFYQISILFLRCHLQKKKIIYLFVVSTLSTETDLMPNWPGISMLLPGITRNFVSPEKGKPWNNKQCLMSIQKVVKHFYLKVPQVPNDELFCISKCASGEMHKYFKCVAWGVGAKINALVVFFLASRFEINFKICWGLFQLKMYGGGLEDFLTPLSSRF